MAKTKLTSELIDEICTYVENGMSNRDAIALSGITETTFYRWMREADKVGSDGKPLKQFRAQRKLKSELEKAAAAFKAYHVQAIMSASKKNWQASAWMLERKFPDEYGRGVDRYAMKQSRQSDLVSVDDGLIEALKNAGDELTDMMGDVPEDV